MKYELIPKELKKIMLINKKVSVIAMLFSIFLSLIFLFMHIFNIAGNGFFLSIPMVFLFGILSIMFVYYDMVVQSQISFAYNEIQVFNKKNRCWRKIPYISITKFKIEEVYGFFYGRHKNDFKAKYICLFFDDTVEIPDVSYDKLFKQKNFFMIAYSDEIWKLFLSKNKLISRND